MTSYCSPIVTLVLSCRVLEILELLYAEGQFFDTPPYRQKNFRVFILDSIMMLGSADSEHTINRQSKLVAIFEEFQPM